MTLINLNPDNPIRVPIAARGGVTVYLHCREPGLLLAKAQQNVVKTTGRGKAQKMVSNVAEAGFAFMRKVVVDCEGATAELPGGKVVQVDKNLQLEQVDVDALRATGVQYSDWRDLLPADWGTDLLGWFMEPRKTDEADEADAEDPLPDSFNT